MILMSASPLPRQTPGSSLQYIRTTKKLSEARRGRIAARKIMDGILQISLGPP